MGLVVGATIRYMCREKGAYKILCMRNFTSAPAPTVFSGGPYPKLAKIEPWRPVDTA